MRASTHKTASKKPRRTREIVTGAMPSALSVVAAVEAGVKAVIVTAGGGGRRAVLVVGRRQGSVERAKEVFGIRKALWVGRDAA